MPFWGMEPDMFVLVGGWLVTEGERADGMYQLLPRDQAICERVY